MSASTSPHLAAVNVPPPTPPSAVVGLAAPTWTQPGGRSAASSTSSTASYRDLLPASAAATLALVAGAATQGFALSHLHAHPQAAQAAQAAQATQAPYPDASPTDSPPASPSPSPTSPTSGSGFWDNAAAPNAHVSGHAGAPRAHSAKDVLAAHASHHAGASASRQERYDSAPSVHSNPGFSLSGSSGNTMHRRDSRDAGVASAASFLPPGGGGGGGRERSESLTNRPSPGLHAASLPGSQQGFANLSGAAMGFTLPQAPSSARQLSHHSNSSSSATNATNATNATGLPGDAVPPSPTPTSTVSTAATATSGTPASAPASDKHGALPPHQLLLSAIMASNPALQQSPELVFELLHRGVKAIEEEWRLASGLAPAPPSPRDAPGAGLGAGLGLALGAAPSLNGHGGAMAANVSRAQAAREQQLNQRRRVVIKIGTASLVDDDFGVKVAQLALVAETIARLKRADMDVLLVSSGAVGTGSYVLGVRERPKNRPKIRALAAVGQARLMKELHSVLAAFKVESAQVLLSYFHLGEFSQSRSAQNTINELWTLGVVPIVNENDVVAVENAGFGDNDRLAAMVATVVDADFLVLLTDVNGVYTADPRADPTAVRIETVSDVDSLRASISVGSAGSTFSTGGMESKLVAAQIATRAGVRTLIMKASDVAGLSEWLISCMGSGTQSPSTLSPMSRTASSGVPALPYPGEEAGPSPLTPPFGTLFLEQRRKQHARKRWLQTLPPRGTLYVNEAAARALESRKTLMAVDIQTVAGDFASGECVQICPTERPDVVLALGFSNYGTADVERIAGRTTDEIFDMPGSSALLQQGASELGAVVDRENFAWSGYSAAKLEELFGLSVAEREE